MTEKKGRKGETGSACPSAELLRHKAASLLPSTDESLRLAPILLSPLPLFISSQASYLLVYIFVYSPSFSPEVLCFPSFVRGCHIESHALQANCFFFKPFGGILVCSLYAGWRGTDKRSCAVW